MRDFGTRRIAQQNTSAITGKLDKKLGKNLFDKDSPNIISGKFLNNINGGTSSNASYFISDYIPVLPNTSYMTSNFSMGGAYSWIYDANKNPVSSFQTNGFTTPANGYYVRMSGVIANMSIQQVELGTSANAYEAYTEYKLLLTTQTSLQTQITTSAAGKLDKKLGKNLFNKATFTTGFYVNYTSGNLTAQNPAYPYSASDWIAVVPNTNYVMTSGNQVAWYDSNKTYISGTQSASQITAPASAAWLRISIPAGSESSLQLEVGTTVTAYENYTEYSPFSSKLPDRDIDVILPSKMYFVKNKQACIYYENVLFKNLNSPSTAYFSAGTNYNRLVALNFGAAATSQTMTAQVITNLKKGILKTITYDVIDSAVNNGKTANILCIGDSFTDIGSYVKELKTLLNAAGVTVNQIGTCGDSTFRAEGLSGGNLANTFLNTSKGVARIVDVTGVTTLPSTTYPGQTYRDANLKDWIIRSGKISGGSGHIVVTKDGATSMDFTGFPASGTLTKQTAGEGDAIINYTNPQPAYFNPFINPSTGQLDIGNYITYWGFNTPNIVVFQFTWNDTTTWATDSSLNAIVSNFKTAADHMHSVFPSAKVIFSIEPCGSVNGNREWNGKKYTVLRFTELMLATFENDSNYNTWLKIAPSYAFVDLVNGYSNSTVTPSARYAITEQSGGDGVHPTTAGMQEIADCIYPVVQAML